MKNIQKYFFTLDFFRREFSFDEENVSTWRENRSENEKKSRLFFVFFFSNDSVLSYEKNDDGESTLAVETTWRKFFSSSFLTSMRFFFIKKNAPIFSYLWKFRAKRIDSPRWESQTKLVFLFSSIFESTITDEKRKRSAWLFVWQNFEKNLSAQFFCSSQLDLFGFYWQNS